MRTIILLVLLALTTNSFSQTTCESYVDDGPLTRLVTPNEDHITSGIYEAVAQRYNSVNATISSVTFWARTNPANSNGDAANTVTVKLLYINPSSGGINGIKITNAETTTVVDTSSVHQMVTAIFSPVIVVSDTNIMVVLEPTSSSTDDFFVKRSTTGDGAGLKLILLKQSGTWFNNQSLGGGFDYDLQILPNISSTVEANFTSSVSGKTVTFTNTSTGATSYFWDFGDSSNDTSTDPVHVYPIAGFPYPVVLTAYAADTSCNHSANATVTTDSTMGIGQNETASFVVRYVAETRQLRIESKKPGIYELHGIAGQLLKTIKVGRKIKWLDLSDLSVGVYIISNSKGSSQRLVIPR